MSKIALLQNHCQVIHYVLDFPTKTRHAFLEYDNHMVEAIASRAPIKPLDIVYWQENLSDPNPDPMALRLECERLPDNGIRIELKPELAPSFDYWDVEATSFAVHGKDIDPEGPITMADIGFINVQVFLKDNLLARIRDDKLIIYDPAKYNPEPLPDDYRHQKTTSSSPAGKKKRRQKTPRDVLKYFSHITTRLTWEPVFKEMNKRSKYLDRKALNHYTGHYNRKGRFYLKGNESLATALGMGHDVLSRTLSWMKAQGLIRLRHRGYPGEGNSIWELPLNISHVFAWLREPPGQKTYLP